MKTILVPTDFSKNAEHALNYAVQLAKSEDAKVILLHVLNVAYINSNIDFNPEHSFNKYESAKNSLIELCNKIKKKYDFDCEYINVEGELINSIIEVSDTQNVDLIVMGTKGANGIKKIFKGSNTANVINRSTRSLIAIPEKATIKGIKKITYASDYQSTDIDALKQLVKIARKNNDASIKIVHVVSGDYEYEYENFCLKKFEEKVAKKIDYEPISYNLLFGLDVGKTLELHVKKDSPSLIGISSKNRNIFKRIFKKSITKQLTYDTTVPLIVFRSK